MTSCRDSGLRAFSGGHVIEDSEWTPLNSGAGQDQETSKHKWQDANFMKAIGAIRTLPSVLASMERHKKHQCNFLPHLWRIIFYYSNQLLAFFIWASSDLTTAPTCSCFPTDVHHSQLKEKVVISSKIKMGTFLLEVFAFEAVKRAGGTETFGGAKIPLP